MPLTRRDLLWSLGGGLAGVTLTPLPWKLLEDSAIWSQRRHALPVPPRGAIAFRPAACTLCAAGCPVRVRCVGARPVAVIGAALHPLGGGACALGLTLHHLAYHPLRLSAPARRVNGRREPLALDAAVGLVAEAVAAARGNGLQVMVLDRRPGRVVSGAWRRLLAQLPRGLYATRRGEEDTQKVLEQSLATPVPLGLDLGHTRTLLSFGAPVLEGWGRPGRMLAVRGGLRVVQVDTWRSPSAALADEWLPLAPGGEGALALALAHVVLAERESHAPEGLRTTVADFTPQRAAARTGIEAARIEALGRALVAQSPSVAIGGGEPGGGPLAPDAERAIALLNVALGSVGRRGGFVARRPMPEPDRQGLLAAQAALEDVPSGSVGLLLLDGADDGCALPWSQLQRTLARGAVVVSLSAFDGPLARESDLLVPGPAPLESWDEVLPTPDAVVSHYSVTAPILQPPPGALDALALVERLSRALGVQPGGKTHEERLRERASAIHAARRGRIVARAADGYAEQASADASALWETLVKGGVWIDDALPEAPLECDPPRPTAASLQAWTRPEAAADMLRLVAFAARGTAGTTPPSPLLSKLYQESDLRAAATTAAINPSTAERLGLEDGQPVRIESAAGSVTAALRIDSLLPPDRIALAAGPDPSTLHPETSTTARGALPVVVAAADGTWRETRVRVREA